ncbi:ATP-binding protein [Vibrio splendidus]|uniref:ATP-binding protein n=1 Tax=Vibrio TaxID=662 RepID=UPI000D36BA80|nr:MULTISPECIES: ATP-binding protein [Vibrio]PTP73539.1 ATP-binding protein [Vibrio splendidus]TKE99271.1 ATP-binding protein [Vibrio kanaloae]TKF64450.1 ATP-binding protein [Vibrio kanaloae]
MAQSPELAGGEGFTFEGETAAFYLSALLAQAYAPGIDERIVVRVSFQQRDFGEPLDDVIVDFEDSDKNPARLSLQVKRSLTISSAKTNTDFRDIVRDSWATLNKSGFRTNCDRYGAAVGTISPAKERALKTLCDWARESVMVEHFDTRFEEGGVASKDIKAVKSDIVDLLKEAKGGAVTNKEVHHFLSHLVLIKFDFLSEGATGPSDAVNRIRDCLAPSDAVQAPLVWSKIVQLARASAGKAGQIDRVRLVRYISPIAKLRGALSFHRDIVKLTELAKSYMNAIPDDIGGERLERSKVLEELDNKLSSARVVQIRGLPGSGKSVIVKRAVQCALDDGPVLFLKAEQLEGTNWNSYAVSQGLSGISLESLLVEIGATGTPTIFIDAIDRIEREKQGIVLDIFQTILESSLLDNWRIVVSLRDTGIEVLHNWLGTFLDRLKVETLGLEQLSDKEAETLANAKPHLRALLFGAAQVREIVRRPFFAKILNQSYVADPSTPTFTPHSEVDLIENWWRRGGYNESGQSSIERQLALLDLARIHAHQLNQPIRISKLTATAHINALRSDGILQNAREGVSVRFAHDIFFEWAFFYALADCGPQWLEEIKKCGEPPAVARVVELVSQWEYVHGEDWSTYLPQTQGPKHRSQWLRAWLVGPFGTSRFEADESQFSAAVFADDFQLFRKVLVWFQAEKTSPNTNILASGLPKDQRQRFAYLLGWPSDFAMWRRLINFILRRITDIPPRLYPEVVSIFEVWQNALSDLQNPTSNAILQQCATWIAATEDVVTPGGANENNEHWKEVPSLKDFRKSLRQLLLKASKSEPAFAASYLHHIITSERICEDVYNDIIAYSPILAQSLPHSLVDLSQAVLLKELPDEQIAREEQERLHTVERRKTILAKPETERTRHEQMVLDGYFSQLSFSNFSSFDWERLSVHDDSRSFWPPSPLREPFYSLFQSSPVEALRLLRELCNHAITSWRQLHRHSYDRGGTPIPLELTFPWGTQSFWGTDREYLWFRAMWAPKVIGCGFMALEEWCFSELKRNRPVDELIQQIVEGNECIAILGVASMLALHTETVSEATLPLFTAQRLLAADKNRMMQDMSSNANLIGFTSSLDKTHIEAVQAANAQPVRKQELCWMVSKALFSAGPFGNQTRNAILNFTENLPFQYEEHRELPDAQKVLTEQALQYAELVDENNYQAYSTEGDSNQLAIVHISPSAAEPQNIAKTNRASVYLRLSSLWVWASKYFEEKTLDDTYTVESAITLARESDNSELFDHPHDETEEHYLGMHRGAIAATAAIALNLRERITQDDLEWARDVLGRAIRLPEEPDVMLSPNSNIPWHHAIFIARGLAADLRKGTAENSSVNELIGLIAHPLESVSLVAIEEACNLWSKDPKFTWASLILAFSLCSVPPRLQDHVHQYGQALHSSTEAQTAIDAALSFYESGQEWAPLPVPPPAWINVQLEKGENVGRPYGEYDTDDMVDAAECWREPDCFWHSKNAAEVLNRIPVAEVLSSEARSTFLDFLSTVVDWTNQKNAPPWVKPGRRARLSTETFEWTHGLGSLLGKVAGLIPLADFKAYLLDPILELEGENCWALLSPFASTYVCSYVYDARVVPADAVATLDLCLDRLFQDSTFKRETYRSGELSGFGLPELVRTLMFVSVERADLAARYVNGDWSEINRILPLIDRFIRAGGWAACVMEPFLTLCERAKANYPAEAFADQVLAIISDGPDSLKGWHGTFIPARIAELVHHFTHRNAPMSSVLAQKLLRILDILVDMGDRRSAALQLSEAFRSIKFTE